MQEMPQVGGFGCLELVLYGIRVLAEQHFDQDSTNESKTSIFLDLIVLYCRDKCPNGAAYWLYVAGICLLVSNCKFVKLILEMSSSQ